MSKILYVCSRHRKGCRKTSCAIDCFYTSEIKASARWSKQPTPEQLQKYFHYEPEYDIYYEFLNWSDISDKEG